MNKTFLKQLKSVTLVELVIATLLLSMVVLTGTAIELAMRRMETKQMNRVKLLGELIPVIDKIEKDFHNSIGSWGNDSVVIMGGNREVRIRVDDTAPLGQNNPTDNWYAFRWNGTAGQPIEYLISNTTFLTNLASGATGFQVTAPTGDADEAITINISALQIPGQAYHPINNPRVTKSTTFYSRGGSLR
jgi:hypothetical protein